MLNQTRFEIATESFTARTWREFSPELGNGAGPLNATAAREISPVPAEHRDQRCPTCHSIVYSRRHRLCGVCSQPLPEAFLFTVSQARRVEQLLERERQQHRKWLADNLSQSLTCCRS